MKHKKESITVHSEGQLVVKSKNKAGEDPNSSQREKEREWWGQTLVSSEAETNQQTQPHHWRPFHRLKCDGDATVHIHEKLQS